MSMATIVPSGHSIGVRIGGIDLSAPLSDRDLGFILRAIGKHSVLCFMGQSLDAARQKAFASRFGTLEVNVASSGYTVPGYPEVMVLSNIVENGRAIGLADAGQDWHTDLSYSRVIAFLNVNYALRVPRRNGVALGDTEFLDMYRAYDELPPDVKRRIEGRTAIHDFSKLWEKMLKRPGTPRKPLLPEQRRQKPPVSHPIVLEHPLSGRRALYCDVGYVTQIDGLSKAESDVLLAQLFEHQMQAKYKWAHRWTEGDVLLWDNMSTVHNAVADYRADEPRLMRRCQVVADWVFTPQAKAAARVE
jgi:taurine dioxygenase